MKKCLLTVTLHILIVIKAILALEPLTTSAAIGAGLAAGVVYQFWDDKIRCQFRECCSNPHWMPRNVPKFEEYFDGSVFGQHIVKKIVSQSIKSHIKRTQPNKALVLSFHGWTGVGKNFVSKFIAKSLYRNGLSSDFVKIFISTVDFPDPAKVDIYKIELQQLIMETVQKCNLAMFIFDEIDKMPEGLVDAIKPFIDYHDHVKGLDFRRTIFILLSNTGGKEINKVALDAWESGRLRESIKYSELEVLIKEGAFNEIGGLHKSAVIDKHLVDRYVPFLPMERNHVASCVIAEAHERNATIVLKPEEIDSVLDELIYFPKSHLLYSTTGCKTVPAKVDTLMYEILDEM